jgi:glycosyltransferase involved in cell wall biosynthesis
VRTQRSTTVSVVIPTKDREELVARAAASVLAQDGVDIDLIVIDDGSQVALSDHIFCGDTRVRVFRNHQSQGVAAARNRGIREARSDWVAFLDDDDVWHPSKLRRQIDAMVTADASWCISGAITIGPDEAMVAERLPADGTDFLEGLCSYNSVPGGGSGVIASRTLLRVIGGFDENLSMAADWEMWHRLAHASPGAAAHDPLVGYTLHAGSMTTMFADHHTEMERLAAAVSHYCHADERRSRWIYLDWAAGGMARHHRYRAGAMKARAAFHLRSPTRFAVALRILLVPVTVEVFGPFRRHSPEPVPVPPWISAALHARVESEPNAESRAC